MISLALLILGLALVATTIFLCMRGNYRDGLSYLVMAGIFLWTSAALHLNADILTEAKVRVPVAQVSEIESMFGVEILQERSNAPEQELRSNEVVKLDALVDGQLVPCRVGLLDEYVMSCIIDEKTTTINPSKK